MSQIDPDQEIRAEAFAHVRRLAANRGHLSSDDIRAGFQFRGQRIPLINPQRGIFKPASMRYLLSIRTVFPKQGNRVWYNDQREVHRQLYEGDEFVDYAFMGTNPDAADNRWLREAYLNAIPIIYFLGVAPGRYQAMLPVFVQDWDPASLKARVSFGVNEAALYQPPETAAERRYALRTVKQRLHQASFREAVLSAYGGRCAISNLPEEALLDAAHIERALNALLEREVMNATVWITDAELDARPERVKTMSVQPPRGAGRVRLLRIPGIGLQPCGGTHVCYLAEIGG